MNDSSKIDLMPPQAIDPQAAERMKHEIELKQTIQKIKRTVVIQSGKGGVGKSTVTWNLALSFAEKGYSVGVMDADITGPSIPTMAGIAGQTAKLAPNKIIPTQVNGVYLVSVDILIDPTQPVIWRGPLKIAAIRQFVSDVAWPDLDILLIDLPPGTSDEALTVSQTFENITGTVIVTTPQKVATHDVRKSINFAAKVGMPILGIVENMSGFICPHCNNEVPIFKKDGGKNMADEMGLVFLGAIPLEPSVVVQADSGDPSVLLEGKFQEAFSNIVEKVAKLLQMN